MGSAVSRNRQCHLANLHCKCFARIRHRSRNCAIPRCLSPTRTGCSCCRWLRLRCGTSAHLGRCKRRQQLHPVRRSEEHTSELQSHLNLVCRLLLEKKKKKVTWHRGAT